MVDPPASGTNGRARGALLHGECANLRIVALGSAPGDTGLEGA
ncbi:hypothetical protein BH23PSE1_BH23PSE1_02440 [soil metagenome]